MSYSEFNVRVIWIVFPVDAVYLVEWYLFYIKYCRYLSAEVIAESLTFSLIVFS